jgi:alkaline phosphatase
MTTMKSTNRLLLAGIMLTLLLAGGCDGQRPTIQHEVGRPRNIILFVADGWGYSHIDATNYYVHGERGRQVYEGFDHIAVSTGSLDTGEPYDPKSAWSEPGYLARNPTDSAAGATALASGITTRNGTVGLDGSGRSVVTVVDAAETEGKSTGLVTSVIFCHATPACFAAHHANRKKYGEISDQMLTKSAVDVIMGAGHPYFDDAGNPCTAETEEKPSFGYFGSQAVWDALVASSVGADANGDGVNDPWHLVETEADFLALASGPTPDRVLGIAHVRAALQVGRSGDQNAGPFAVAPIEGIPTLADMTQAALNVLDNDPDGLFLMVEGGAVDWASHGNASGRMIEEMVSFDEAIQATVAWVNRESNWDETLILVTGDHECGHLTGEDVDSEWHPVENRGKGTMPGMRWRSGSHTNSLIPLFWKGRGGARIRDAVQGVDPKRGDYIHLSDIGELMLELTGEE